MFAYPENLQPTTYNLQPTTYNPSLKSLPHSATVPDVN